VSIETIIFFVRHFFPSLDIEKIGINEFNEAGFQAMKLVDMYRGNKFDLTSYEEKRERELTAYRNMIRDQKKREAAHANS